MIIDKEFHSLIPSLTPEEYKQLEANILADGIREPLITWQGVLVDGHNRFEIAQKYGLEFQTVEKEFADRNAVIEWMVLNQFGRRNLSNYQRSLLALRLKPVFEAKAKEKEHERKTTLEISTKSLPAIDTRKEIAILAGVSDNTIAKVQKIQMQARPEVISRLKAGSMSINEAYNATVSPPVIFKEKPHVANNSGNNEWYTPEPYIVAARAVLGEIDLDPASSELANETVKAKTFYTAETNGLLQEWGGTVWMNPPYAGELIGRFAEKLVDSVICGSVHSAIVLVNNATETGWFEKIVGVSAAVVFPTSRVKFNRPDGTTGAPLQGQAILYIGDNKDLFLKEFSPFGWGATL